MTGPAETRAHQDTERQSEGISFEAAWRERFESFAAERDDDAGIAGWSATGLDARIRRFGGLWHGRFPGALWLDVGCGAGTYTRFIAEQGVSVIGVDYSMPTVIKARTRSRTDIKFVVSDVRNLPFSPRLFDGVLCFGVLQALADNKEALLELVGLVRPGGELWVDALNRGCVVNVGRVLWRTLRGRRVHLRYDWPQTIRRILIAYGCDDAVIFWMPIVPSRWPRIQRLLERPLMRRLLQAAPVAGLLVSHSFMVRGRVAPGQTGPSAR